MKKKVKDSIYGKLSKFIKVKYMPEYVIGIAILNIFISLILIFLIDLRNIYGLRDVLFDLNPYYFFFEYQPFVFYHWYRNGGVAELFQWVFLGGASIIAAILAGRLLNRDKKALLFWLIMSVVFILMLIEDAGDPRHTIRSYVQAVYSEAGQGIMGSITELFYFSILGFIPLYGYLKYGAVLRKNFKSWFYFIIGFISYFVATFLSFIGSAVDFYNYIGRILYEWLLEIGDSLLVFQWQAFEAEEGWEFISFFLMDSLFEEAIELIGAASFFAAAISYLLFELYSQNENQIKK